MTRIVTVVLACWLSFLMNQPVSGADTGPAPPNIVFILSDDQAWTDYGFMGHPVIQTPHLDRLAARSAVFPRGYVPTALCRPSLATLVTGLYAHQHKISGNDPSVALAAADSPQYAELRERLISHIDAWPTLPKLLAQRGYLSHQSGKWWEGPYQRGGFTHGMTRGFPAPGGRHGDDGLKIGREGLQPIFEFVDLAIAQKQPFYVWYAPFLPHAPHTPPERLLAKYQDKVDSPHVAKYYAMCEWFDETCGQLIDYIDQKGLTSNTLFVYIGDNGWIQDPQSPNYAPRSKQSPNEGGVRQPIMLSWPGVIAPGTREDLVSSIDLMPTILSAAGAEIPANLPGLDLLPLVRDGRPLARDTIFGEGFAHDVADIDKPETSLLYRWAIEGRWKLILTYDGVVGRYASSHPRTERRPQLFDLLSDPHEQQNVAAEHPEVVGRLADKIANWWPVTERKTVTHWTETPREGWVVSPVGRSPRGRISLPTDRLESAWLQGTLSLPDRTKDESPSAEGLPAWKRVKADENGAFSNFGPPNAWLATFVDSSAEQVWLLDAQGHSSVRVNDVPRCGDIYSNGSVELPVLLQAGTNTLIFSGSRGRIVAKLRRPDKDLFLSTRDTTFPHIVRGESDALWGALLLVNATNEVQTGLVLTAAGPGFRATETPLPPLVPLSVRKIGFRVEPDPATAIDAWKDNDVALDLTLARALDGEQTQPTAIDQVSVRWAVRDAGQTHRRTFVSAIDGSVQYYGVVPPLAGPTDPDQRPGVVLSLHGAGVEGEGQANVYAAKPNLYIIAPTNRRNFGFDWEDWGRWDALEVLQLASARFQPDPHRTYLTGHSMGGHGTWHIGSLFPDRFAAIGPSAGWISFSTYAGGPSRVDDDLMSQMLRRPITASDTLSRVQNLAYPGVYILHGDRDDNVPVEQARAMREQLAKFHPDFVYKEQPGAGHWWGNACCDWPALFAFFADHALPPAEKVERIDFTTPGPAVSPRCFWVTVAAQVQQGQISRVNLQFDRDKRTVSGTTENVYRLALQLGAIRATQADATAAPATLNIEIDGVKLTDVPLEQKTALWLEKGEPAWHVIAEPSLDEKGPHRCGSLKEAFQNRFVLVYGTQGTPEENAWMLARARFDAETFWYRGNGSVDVVADTQWKSVAETDRNVIVYGNAAVNAAWQELLAQCPMVVGRGQWQIPSEPPHDSSAAVWMVRPRPGSSLASVAAIGGTDLTAMQATNRPPIFSSGTGYPDLIVAAPDYLQQGAAGVMLAGYFGIDWSFEKGEWARQ